MKLEEYILKNKTYIIAEMSANHAGKLENALEIVRKAKLAGADCLKTQTYKASTITLECDNEYFTIKDGLWKKRNLYSLYSEAATPWEWQAEIMEECKKQGLDFLSTPFDKSAVDFLNSIGVEAFKIASFELVDIPLIKYAAAFGKKMIISTGMGTKKEIKDAVTACESVGNHNIVLLKCCSSYPSDYKDVNLQTIVDMRKEFHYPIGLSDHSLGDLVACTAVAMGVNVLEKHICLDKTISSADQSFSLTFEDFHEMVCKIRSVENIKGSIFYGPTESEQESLQFRKSIFSVKDISAGDIFSEDNIRVIRPGDGLEPSMYEDLLGKRAKRNIKRGMPLDVGDV